MSLLNQVYLSSAQFLVYKIGAVRIELSWLGVGGHERGEVAAQLAAQASPSRWEVSQVPRSI